jgi:uncharacterized membrane protein
MTTLLIGASCALALAWLPLALRFNRGWKNRRNPVSLAICMAALLFAYTNILFALAIAEEASWTFFAKATHVFDLVVVVNFYVAFRWSDRRFVDARQKGYSIPPTNSTGTPRGS